MTSRLLCKFLLGVALLLCAMLAARWSQARTRSEQLTAELREIRIAPAPASERSAPFIAPAAPIEESASVDPELETRKALLAEARAIPELARREATLVAIRRIKAQHAANPPPSRVLPPPLGAKYGAYFTELFTDPQYLALVREDWEAGSGNSKVARLRRLDVSEDTKRQVMEVEFDSFLASAEIGNYTTPEEQQAAMQERRRILDENQKRVGQLLGDHALKQYVNQPAQPGAVPSEAARNEAFVNFVRTQVSSGSLAERLSYSNSPLTEADKERLQALLVSTATPRTITHIWYDVEFFKQAESILNPTQLDALRQLQEEREARTLRSRLPKSSELPRTTRRTRLEGGG